MRISAGILLHRTRNGAREYLIVHHGGPQWANKNEGTWSIPKGGQEPGEALFDTARREFTEETGFTSQGPYIPLTPVRMKSGKMVHAWGCPGDVDPAALTSIPMRVEWPPRSGKFQECPEIDRARYATLDDARTLLIASLVPLVEEMDALLART